MGVNDRIFNARAAKVPWVRVSGGAPPLCALFGFGRYVSGGLITLFQVESCRKPKWPHRRLLSLRSRKRAGKIGQRGSESSPQELEGVIGDPAWGGRWTNPNAAQKKTGGKLYPEKAQWCLSTRLGCSGSDNGASACGFPLRWFLRFFTSSPLHGELSLPPIRIWRRADRLGFATLIMITCFQSEAGILLCFCSSKPDTPVPRSGALLLGSDFLCVCQNGHFYFRVQVRVVLITFLPNLLWTKTSGKQMWNRNHSPK